MRIDPELAPMVDALPPTDLTDLEGARAMLDGLIATMAPGHDERVTKRELAVPGLDGDPDVRILLYEPVERPADAVPGIVYIHGGGFVLGRAETEELGAETLGGDLGAVVASVDYRLAPEHPFPAGLHDCFAALTWLDASADELGVDRRRLMVFGASAGGGLAAATTLMARDRGGPALCFQFLGIPELDDRLQTESMRAYTDSPLWNQPSAVLSWRYYLHGDGPVPERPPDVSPYAAPARATDLAGLPPTYVSVAQYDPLCDEGIEYARRLALADVPVELHLLPGTFHGSTMMTGAWTSRRHFEEQRTVLRRALSLPEA